MFIDNYMHPIDGVIYVEESVIGYGVNEESLREEYDFSCTCSSFDGSSKCCKDREECACVRVLDQNYVNDLLCDNKLFGTVSVFECGSKCSCYPQCSNNITQRGPHQNLCIVEYGAKGYGVCTTSTIPKGSYICEYAGEIISLKEAEKRHNTGKGTYLVTLNEFTENDKIQTVVDARYISNIGRYINHSCSPNCSIIPVRSGMFLPKICIFASKNLCVGEEITYHYNPGSGSLSDTPCLCESKNCLKYLPNGQ